MPLSVPQSFFRLESVETAVIPPDKSNHENTFTHDSNIFAHFAVKALLKINSLVSTRASKQVECKNLLILSLLVPFYQFSKQKSEVKSLHNSLWSLHSETSSLLDIIPRLWPAAVITFYINFSDRLIVFGTLTLSLVERSALRCAHCRAGEVEGEEENQPENETPALDNGLISI